jgi:hypothetical protein
VSSYNTVSFQVFSKYFVLNYLKLYDANLSELVQDYQVGADDTSYATKQRSVDGEEAAGSELHSQVGHLTGKQLELQYEVTTEVRLEQQRVDQMPCLVGFVTRKLTRNCHKRQDDRQQKSRAKSAPLLYICSDSSLSTQHLHYKVNCYIIK